MPGSSRRGVWEGPGDIAEARQASKTGLAGSVAHGDALQTGSGATALLAAAASEPQAKNNSALLLKQPPSIQQPQPQCTASVPASAGHTGIESHRSLFGSSDVLHSLFSSLSLRLKNE